MRIFNKKRAYPKAMEGNGKQWKAIVEQLRMENL